MRLITTLILLAMAGFPGSLAQAPSDAVAPKASPDGTSAPPADLFKNGGRPESSAGGVQEPAAAPGQAASPDLTRKLEAVARTTLTAQQYGNLASMRHTTGAIHDLGDRMIVTNSRINKALAAAIPGHRDGEQMPASERSQFDALARHSNEGEFAASVAQWVAESYPPLIAALEATRPSLSEVVASSIPELRSQLDDARRILQSAAWTEGNGGTGSVAPLNPSRKSD